jgi:RNA polymerase sigma factor (sigma-70 family)
MDEDDASLLAAVCEGSDRAFNTLIDRRQQAVRVFLQGLTSGVDEADDIAQEVFLAVWKNARSYNGKASVKSWLFAIAWRKAKDAQRVSYRRRRRDDAYQEAQAMGPARPIAADDLVILDQALATLPLDQRAAVMLCVGCAFTGEEAAQTLGLPLGTVKSHVLRGRARLMEAFGEAP